MALCNKFTITVYMYRKQDCQAFLYQNITNVRKMWQIYFYLDGVNRIKIVMFVLYRLSPY